MVYMLCNVCAKPCTTVCPMCFSTCYCSFECAAEDVSEHKKICETLAVIKIRRELSNLHKRKQNGQVNTISEEEYELEKISQMLAKMPESVHKKFEETTFLKS